MKNLFHHFILTLIFLLLSSVRAGEEIKANDNNIIEIKLSEDIVDIKYISECQDCICAQKLPIYAETKEDNVFFGKPRISSTVNGNDIVSFHKSENAEISYSHYSVSNAGKLEQKVALKVLPEFENLKSFSYEWSIDTFMGWSEDTIILIKEDNTRKIGIESHKFEKLRLLDTNTLLGVKFKDTLEIFDISSNKLEKKTSIPLKDLGLETDEFIADIEVDTKHKSFLAFTKNSNSPEILKLDYSNLDEISILNIFLLREGVVERVFESEDAVYVLEKYEKLYGFSKYQKSSPESLYSDLIFKGKIDIPYDYEGIFTNSDHIIIDVGEYAYLIDIDSQIHTQSLEFSFRLIKKSCPDDFYPIIYKENVAIISVDASVVGVHNLKLENQRNFVCYKKSNGKEDIEISFLKKISEADSQYSIDKITYNVDFAGTNPNLESIEKVIISKSNEPEKLPVEKQHHDKPDKPDDGDDDKGNGKDDGNDDDDDKGDDDDDDDENNQNDGGHHNTDHNNNPEKNDKDDKGPTPSNIDPEKTYDSLIEDWVIGIIVGFVLIFCFGVLIGIVYKFIKSEVDAENPKIKHVPLEDESKLKNDRRNDSELDQEADTDDLN